MRRVKQSVEDEVAELRGKEEIFRQTIKEKDQEIAALASHNDNLEKQVAEYNLTKKGLESKVNLLTQKLASETEISKKKIEKFQEDVRALSLRNLELK